IVSTTVTLPFLGHDPISCFPTRKFFPLFGITEVGSADRDKQSLYSLIFDRREDQCRAVLAAPDRNRGGSYDRQNLKTPFWRPCSSIDRNFVCDAPGLQSGQCPDASQ